MAFLTLWRGDEKVAERRILNCDDAPGCAVEFLEKFWAQLMFDHPSDIKKRVIDRNPAPSFGSEQIDFMHRVAEDSILAGKEMGFNILGGLKNPEFDAVQTGYEDNVWIPGVSTSIGTFHTHPAVGAGFSARDIVSTIFKRQNVICIGGKSIKNRTYYTEVICYVADPLSEGYEKLIKKGKEFSSALSIGDWDKLKRIGKEMYDQGHKAFEKYDYGFRVIKRPKKRLTEQGQKMQPKRNRCTRPDKEIK